jgi:hypothetical protein
MYIPLQIYSQILSIWTNNLNVKESLVLEQQTQIYYLVLEQQTQIYYKNQAFHQIRK